MKKATYLVLGSVVLFGTMLMVGVSPDVARGAPQPGQDGMDIRALERTMDMKALPNGDLDPAVFR